MQDGLGLSYWHIKTGNMANVSIYSISHLIEPVSRKGYKLASAPIKDSDQPVHLCRMIRAFHGRSMGSKGFNAS